MPKQRILLIHLQRIGDILVTTPLVRAIRKAYPQATIEYLTESAFLPILSENPHIDRLIKLRPQDKNPIAHLSFLSMIAAHRYDLVIDMFGNPRSAAISLCSRAPMRIGFDYRVRSAAYTHVVFRSPKPEYVASTKLRLLTPLGIPGAGLDLDFYYPNDCREQLPHQLAAAGLKPNESYVCFAPDSRRQPRIWPRKYYTALAKMLFETFALRTVLLWGPGEKDPAQAIAASAPEAAIVAPPTSLHQMGALLAQAQATVCNDNGPKHLSIAVGTPTITIHGPTNPACWTPPGEKHTALWAADLNCITCEQNECSDLKCMEMITPEQALAAVANILNSAGAQTE